jgi:DNA-binding GntR family transcriptional regulator
VSIGEIREATLSRFVRDEMLSSILAGEFVPGQRINELDFASRLKVSRVPVREALRALESVGILVSRKHLGMTVRELTSQEVQDLYQLRAVLDGFCGRSAASLPSPKLKKLSLVLKASVNAMKQSAANGDCRSYYFENLAFHWAIVESADNRQISDTYRATVQKLHIARMKNLASDEQMRKSIQEHGLILKAISSGDTAASASLMESHVNDAYIRAHKHYIQDPDHEKT